MTDDVERRWDDAMEQAWTGFRKRLADRLAELGDEETLLVEVAHDEELQGAAPYCQVLAEDRWLRVEAVSNAFLDEVHRLDGEQEAALAGLGFVGPEGLSVHNFRIDLEQREADRAAWLVVHALRHVYAVLHPAYLVADGIEPPTTDQDVPLAAAEVDATRFPQSPEELMAALVDVAGGMLGHEPELDDDGDLPIQTERAVLYVTVARQAPRVLLFATLVSDVVDEQRALVEVNLLNRAEFGLTFVLVEGRITLRRELPLTAFVASDVRAELMRIITDLDRWVSELLARVGGRGGAEDGEARQPQDRRSVPPPVAPEDDRYDQAMRVLRELESGERGSVDPATMLRIFHGDRDLLLRAIRHSQARAGYWGTRLRKAEQEGKAAYAKLCRAQQRYHHELRRRLRRALRMAVQAAVKPERQEQLALFAEDEASA